MGYRNYDDIATRWTKVVRGQEVRNYEHERMPIYGDLICSYGSHFVLAQPLRNRKGEVEAFLLNGDRATKTTTKHQDAVRSAIARTGLPSVILPYSALDQAGIEPTSVRIVEVTEDRWETTTEVRHEFPAGAVWEYEHVTLPGSAGWVNSKTGEWLDQPSYVRPVPPEPQPRYSTFAASGEPDAYEKYQIELESWRREHGEWNYTYGVQKNTGRKVLLNRKNGHNEWELFEDENGELAYRKDNARHWLGEALITADVHYQREVKCSLCGGKGEVEGYTVPRRAEVQGPAQWEFEQYPIKGWIDVPSCAGCGGVGTVMKLAKRRAYFLSAFDRNETRPSYFFCELPPKVKPTTVEEALATLKPRTVKLAEQMGREVKRQGDIFAVPIVNLDTRKLSKQAASRIKMGHVFNTNHVVTEQMVMPDGTVYARGTLRHAPEFRRPDHARVTIGKEWHLILKNTVPTAA